MVRYIALRVLDAIPTVLLVLTLVFFALRILPGDPAQVALGEFATPDQIAALRAKMGLDVPLWRQYVTFLWSVATFDFGTSFVSTVPVRDMLAENLPYTVELTILATIFGLLMGLPLGVASATRRGTITDFGARVFALLGYAIPDFYLGALLLIWFALDLGLFPISGGGGGFVDRSDHLILPALALGVIKAAFMSRLTRGALLDTLGARVCPDRAGEGRARAACRLSPCAAQCVAAGLERARTERSLDAVRRRRDRADLQPPRCGQHARRGRRHARLSRGASRACRVLAVRGWHQLAHGSAQYRHRPAHQGVGMSVAENAIAANSASNRRTRQRRSHASPRFG